MQSGCVRGAAVVLWQGRSRKFHVATRQGTYGCATISNVWTTVAKTKRRQAAVFAIRRHILEYVLQGTVDCCAKGCSLVYRIFLFKWVYNTFYAWECRILTFFLLIWEFTVYPKPDRANFKNTLSIPNYRPFWHFFLNLKIFFLISQLEIGSNHASLMFDLFSHLRQDETCICVWYGPKTDKLTFASSTWWPYHSLPRWHFIKHSVGGEDGEHDAGPDMPSLAGHGTAAARSLSWAWGSSATAAAASTMRGRGAPPPTVATANVGTNAGDLAPAATAAASASTGGLCHCWRNENTVMEVTRSELELAAARTRLWRNEKDLN
jgi:hypothetical protein